MGIEISNYKLRQTKRKIKNVGRRGDAGKQREGCGRRGDYEDLPSPCALARASETALEHPPQVIYYPTGYGRIRKVKRIWERLSR